MTPWAISIANLRTIPPPKPKWITNCTQCGTPLPEPHFNARNISERRFCNQACCRKYHKRKDI
jgi:hypothetical protein